MLMSVIDQFDFRSVAEHAQRFFAVVRKRKREIACAILLAEFVVDQQFEIGFVVDDQDSMASGPFPRAFFWIRSVRVEQGRQTTNSAPLPGSLSARIVAVVAAHHDVVAERKAQAGPPRRFGCEKWIEDLWSTASGGIPAPLSRIVLQPSPGNLRADG